MNRFETMLQKYRSAEKPLPAIPIAVYPGLKLINKRVCDLTHDAQVQADAVSALHERYTTSVLLSAMDLSAEAEAFGCTIYESETEIPTVMGNLITCRESAQDLNVPEAGNARTAVYIETVRRLRDRYPHEPILGGCIGPFSLASRLAGVSETLLLTMTDPEYVKILLQKSVRFLTAYIREFIENGADGMLMAEPAAGLLSPKGMREFSSSHIAAIRQCVEEYDSEFALIVHNCAAKTKHLDALLETGCRHFHFGSPMAMTETLERVRPEITIYGNLDPSAVFCLSAPEETASQTRELIRKTGGYKNFGISSGCDLPPQTPIDNLDTFFEVVATTCQRPMEATSH